MLYSYACGCVRMYCTCMPFCQIEHAVITSMTFIKVSWVIFTSPLLSSPLLTSPLNPWFCALQKIWCKIFALVPVQGFLKGLLRLMKMQHPSHRAILPPLPPALLSQCMESAQNQLSLPSLIFTHSWLTQPFHGCSTVKHVKAHICTGSSLGKNHAPVPLTSVDEAPTLTCLYTVSPVQRAAAFPPLKHGCQASFHLAAEWSGSWLQRSPERGALMAAFCASLSVGSIWARKHVILTERGGDKK